MTARPLSLTVNGKQIGPIDVPDDMMMQDFLHEYLNLTGSRMGCGEGVCHACTVILENPDGRLEEHPTCITGAHFFAGKSVKTFEGYAERVSSGQLVSLPHLHQPSMNPFPFPA